MSKDFTTTIQVDQNPQQVFNAINNPRAWWSQEIAGDTDKAGEVFLYHYKDVHICKIKVAELVPVQKVVWEVLDNHFNFTRDKTEWVGTTIVFEIAQKNGKTQLTFTHRGLVPQYECYDVCHDAWTSYIQGSLHDLIASGKGKPNAKEGGLNQELIEKWQLPVR
jgi:hypothetical protein